MIFSLTSIDVSDYNLSLINQAWKKLLFYENASWVKKAGNEYFDVPMACYHGAEVHKLVGTYILNRLKDIFQHHSVGLYRDGDIVVVKGLSGPEIERMKKRVIEMFKDYGLKITIKGDLKIVNFLDMTFNLHKNTYKPYRKPDNQPAYTSM